MTQFSKRILSAVLAVIMLLSMVPLSAMAAPASDLPDNMVDSPILRALEYTGYDVQKQKDDGTLYQTGSYGSRCPESVRSNTSFNIDLKKNGFKLTSKRDFVGNSHEKITEEIYERV